MKNNKRNSRKSIKKPRIFPKHQVKENNELNDKTEITTIEATFSAKTSNENNKFESYVSENKTFLIYSVQTEHEVPQKR